VKMGRKDSFLLYLGLVPPLKRKGKESKEKKVTSTPKHTNSKLTFVTNTKEPSVF